jgi:hypothetical protein
VGALDGFAVLDGISKFGEAIIGCAVAPMACMIPRVAATIAFALDFDASTNLLSVLKEAPSPYQLLVRE